MEDTFNNINLAWAFAKQPGRNHKTRRTFNNGALITACSPEAKMLGVRAGMRYDQALRTAPGLKILVIGGRSK